MHFNVTLPWQSSLINAAAHGNICSFSLFVHVRWYVCIRHTCVPSHVLLCQPRSQCFFAFVEDVGCLSRALCLLCRHPVCHPSCKTCHGPSDADCATCHPHATQAKGRCRTPCKAEQYLNLVGYCVGKCKRNITVSSAVSCFSVFRIRAMSFPREFRVVGKSNLFSVPSISETWLVVAHEAEPFQWLPPYCGITSEESLDWLPLCYPSASRLRPSYSERGPRKWRGDQCHTCKAHSMSI